MSKHTLLLTHLRHGSFSNTERSMSTLHTVRSFSFFNFRICITTVASLFFPQTTRPNISVVFSRPAPKIDIGMFMLTSSNSGKRTSPFVLVSALKKMQVAFCHCPSCLSHLWWQPAFVHFFLLPKCKGINWH